MAIFGRCLRIEEELERKYAEQVTNTVKSRKILGSLYHPTGGDIQG
jgi:hypothetical protein